MRYYADLHIHSKYSMACSRDCDLEHLAWWAGRKGVAVVGTGDFTHPGWAEELRNGLVPAEPGLFRLRPETEAAVLARLPPACRTPVRFLLSSEISTIYKRDERTRKVHHLLYAPDFDSVAEITRRLARIGNLASDGRPILGLDSRDLLEITLESGEGTYLVPAHIWTPWFAALGSKSGFDAIADCYADLSEHIVALETGLSSDPAMNRRVSGLDQYRLVSNSDAHSPPMLGREATVFDTNLDYWAIRGALRGDGGLAGTVEFFPEEGKYHLDGHRACGVRTMPAETAQFDGRCPVCDKPLTVGVLHRVDALADRGADRAERSVEKPVDAYSCLVPLPEVLGEIAGVGPKTKTVAQQLDVLASRLGPELSILQDLPLDAVADEAAPPLVEALSRLRNGEVVREPGYDGVYGRIQIFNPEELEALRGSSALFELARAKPSARRRTPAPAPQGPAGDRPLAHTPKQANGAATGGDLLDQLDDEQREAATVSSGPVLVVAGPGTGKTRVLTYRLAWRVTSAGVDAGSCLAVTFSRRAREESLESPAADREEGSVTISPEAVTVAAEQLAPLALECGRDAGRFLAELVLGIEVDLWDPRADRISLLTWHAAKGLEFPVVMLVGCDDGLLPLRHGNSAIAGVGEAEERRLLFVGMTRATVQLVLTGVRRRQRWGAIWQCEPFPFLAALPPELTLQGTYTSTEIQRPAAPRQLRLL